MALTVTIDDTNMNVVGSKRQVPVAITFDSSYPLGGEAITAAQCGLVVLDRLIFLGPARLPGSTDLGCPVDFDKANLKVIAFWGDNNNAADAPLVEVADTTSLASYVVQAIAVGY